MKSQVEYPNGKLNFQKSDKATSKYRTWLKLLRAACKFANIPVGGSLVILMEFSRIP